MRRVVHLQVRGQGCPLVLSQSVALPSWRKPPPALATSRANCWGLSILSPEHENPTPPATSRVNAGYSHHPLPPGFMSPSRPPNSCTPPHGSPLHPVHGNPPCSAPASGFRTQLFQKGNERRGKGERKEEVFSVSRFILKTHAKRAVFKERNSFQFNVMQGPPHSSSCCPGRRSGASRGQSRAETGGEAGMAGVGWGGGGVEWGSLGECGAGQGPRGISSALPFLPRQWATS